MTILTRTKVKIICFYLIFAECLFSLLFSLCVFHISGRNSDNFDENGHRYVGLVNQAMTCYLNSLIQTLYMTPEFRNTIYR